MAQNKLHYAIHYHTAAEVIVAKNYLTKEEMQDLNQFVTMYLDYAERQARRQIPMTMEDWARRLDVFLEFKEIRFENNLALI